MMMRNKEKIMKTIDTWTKTFSVSVVKEIEKVCEKAGVHHVKKVQCMKKMQQQQKTNLDFLLQ